ncbi:MAG: hypothetical protein U1E59_15030 [Amaricoccus sp.]
MPEATSNVDQGGAAALGAVLLGLVAAMAAAVLVLVNGYGIFLAFLAYSLAGAAMAVAGTAGRLAVQSATGHFRRSAAPRRTRSGTFA